MHIINYVNYVGIVLFVALCIASVLKKKINSEAGNSAMVADTGIVYVLLSVIVMLAAFLRLYKLGAVPYGLQQDEASLGYDAFCLATKGIDRNGYHYPVYPITWGCGGGSPLMIYINVLTIKLFGTGIVKLRLLPAVLGIATVVLFYFALKELFDSKISLFGTAFLAVCPWHVILSRWSLDSNIMPFVMLLAMYLFMRGLKSGSTVTYCLSAAVYALCMYCYGSANIVVPIHLVLISILCISRVKIRWGQLVASIVTFIVVCIPLGIFYAVNYLGLPEIVTDFISFNKFTASRTGDVFLSSDSSLLSQIADNLKALAKVITIGDSKDMYCHFMPGFSTVYRFTFPITFLGIAVGVKELFAKRTEGDAEADRASCVNGLWLTMLVACFVLGALIEIDISRMVVIFLPLIFFFLKGLGFIGERLRKGAIAAVLVVAAASVLFVFGYFTRFNSLTADIFMPGYGEAIARAYEIAGDDRPIYSTYKELSAPFTLALYYTDYDPEKFYTTVEYKDPDAEFRIASKFGNFSFGKLSEIDFSEVKNGGVFVAHTNDLEGLTEYENHKIENFGKYHVIYD